MSNARLPSCFGPAPRGHRRPKRCRRDTYPLHHPQVRYIINLYCLEGVLWDPGQRCGCPDCLANRGMTAVYTTQDFMPGVIPLGYWQKSACSEKLARLVKERIVPGWPGGESREGK